MWCTCVHKYSSYVIQNHFLFSVRLMARIILKKFNDAESEEFELLPDGRKRRLDDLLTHKEEIILDKKRAKGIDIIYSGNWYTF